MTARVGLRAEEGRGNSTPASAFTGCSPVRDDSGGASQNTRHTCHSCHAVGKDFPANTERMDNRYSAIRAYLFLQDGTGNDVVGILHGFNLVPTWDEVVDARYCGAGLGENRPHACGRAIFFEGKGTGTAADIIFSDGKYGRGIAVERMKNLFTVLKMNWKINVFIWNRDVFGCP